MKDKEYHSLLHLSITVTTSHSLPPQTGTVTVLQHILSFQARQYKIKCTLSNIPPPLCSSRGPLALYTSVWLMYESGSNTNVNQPWFTKTASKLMASHSYYPISRLVLQTGYLHHSSKTFTVQHTHITASRGKWRSNVSYESVHIRSLSRLH